MLSLFASLLALFAEGRYILSILKRTTRPSFASWFVFGISMTSVFASSYALGARSSLLLIGTFTLLNLVIAGLAFRLGVRTFSPSDIVFLGLSMIGLVLWWNTKDPWYSLLVSAGVDACGYFLMYRKMLHYPGEEDLVSWEASTVAYALNLFLVVHWVPEEYLFSMLNTLWCGIAVLLAFRGRSFRPVVQRATLKR